MADLYGAAPSLNQEPEEISTLLSQLLHNSSFSSSSISSSCTQFKMNYIQSFPSEVPGFSNPAANSGDEMEIPVEFRDRLGGPAVRPESEPRVNLSDPEMYFEANVKESNALSSAGDFSYDREEVLEASEFPSNQERPRSSSKRSRAAEVHNLSEKRRRSRINEKMKALQNLIPNSNKTDKASMLDEAIEYLKQLQLQVQMLSMRNGLSLHPMCSPGVLQPMQLPPSGMGYDEENGFFSPNTGVAAFSSNEESSTPNLSNPCTISNQPMVTHSAANITNLEALYGFEPSAEAHYGSFTHLTSPKITLA